MKRYDWIALFLFIAVLQPLYAQGSTPPTFESLAAQATPAVVFIGARTDYFDEFYASNPESYYTTVPFLYECIRPFYEWYWPPEHWYGSGFFIDPDGYIVTNFHVIENARQLFVCVPHQGNAIYEVAVVGTDDKTDIAVLKIENRYLAPFPYLTFGDSHRISIGQSVAAIGNPKGEKYMLSFTSGVVSGLDRHFSVFDIEGFIQTDTAVNGGNSGGPLLDLQGEVVGVVCASHRRAQNMHFAIPSHMAKRVVHQLIAKGEVSTGYLGIQIAPCCETLFHVFEFDQPDRLVIAEVIGSPASHADLQKGDRLLEINDCPIRSQVSLRNYMYALEPGTEVKLLVQREGVNHTVFVELEEEEELVERFFAYYICTGILVI